MARRTMAGQLNMFDFYSSMDENTNGEVEMVSLVPNFDDEPEVVDEPEVMDEPEVKEIPEVAEELEMVEKPVFEKKAIMSRTYKVDGEIIEIAYLNYNKVSITRGKQKPEVHEFESSKEAVDFYVQKMQQMEPDD